MTSATRLPPYQYGIFGPSFGAPNARWLVHAARSPTLHDGVLAVVLGDDRRCVMGITLGRRPHRSAATPGPLGPPRERRPGGRQWGEQTGVAPACTDTSPSHSTLSVTTWP